ncbi:Zn-dependent hydrolase [Sporosarcina sp. BI001-red]|uniref:M20 family metallo-hydrolase n=1 Tax=Sporosarcina sp. BI001-red TaxID=2282866 RepID=UPI000E2818C5|nr:M20 family metallo-hydrolase [Sporosarcina sp. BI001-red]REB08784.1 Zn-dependent hydrolase [Sporosarcina sp. BI001-red]
MTTSETLFTKLTTGYDQSLSRGGIDGRRIAERLSELSMIGASAEGGVTRPGYSCEEKQAKQVVKSWMEQSGLKVTEDGAGNVIGRLEGTGIRKTIVSGSHVDSVPNGGNFDGPLGVISALEVVEAWKETGYLPRKSYEVVIFSDEEGTRFGAGLTGSHAMVGQLTEDATSLKVDKDGKSFETVIEEYGSSLPAVWRAKREMNDIELFVELHIEQGKILEKSDVSVGAVKGIAGPVWMNVTFQGEAGHAGNTPMDDRRDSMVAASHFIHMVSTLPRQFSETAVATIGKLNVFPNGVNVIPQKVELTVDIRDIHEDKRDCLVEAIIEAAEQSGVAHHVDVTCQKTLAVQPLLVDEELLSNMKESISEFGMEPMELMSGAGHDAMVMGREVPAAMLFVKSKKGISHNPEEWTDLSDCVIGVHVMKDFIEKQMERS